MLPENGLDTVEELFRARLITFLTGEGLLQPDLAHRLGTWKLSGFHVHRSRRIQPGEREDLKRIVRYIIRTLSSTEHWECKPPMPYTGTAPSSTDPG